MKPTRWMVAAGMLILLASCGENSTTKDTDEDTATVTTTTTDNTTAANYTVEVPATTRTTFETKYPSATNVRWSRYNSEVVPVEWDLAGWPTLDTSDFYVQFDWEGNNYYAWYDENGNWIGTTYTVTDHSKLPTTVNNAIKSQYPGYTIVEVDHEMDKNRSAWEVELQKGDQKVKILVDENGKVIKKKTSSSTGPDTKDKPDK